MQNPTTTPGTPERMGAASRATPTDESMMTGLFRDRDRAEKGYEALTARGYGPKDINVVMSDATRKKYFDSSAATTELGNKAAKGAGVGGAIGGTLGAIAAAIAAVGTSLVIPGLGLVVAGPVAAALAGAGAGGAAGGILGALIGAGIPEERVKHYEKGIQDGGILIGVKPRTEEDASFMVTEWTKAGGEHVYR